MWPRFHRDVKIFMEACLSHAKKRIPAQMIVTNDHKFSSMFLNSPLAEDVLHSGYGCAANPRRSPCQASRGTCGWDVSSMAGRECNSIGLAKPTLHGNIWTFVQSCVHSKFCLFAREFIYFCCNSSKKFFPAAVCQQRRLTRAGFPLPPVLVRWVPHLQLLLTSEYMYIPEGQEQATIHLHEHEQSFGWCFSESIVFLLCKYKINVSSIGWCFSESIVFLLKSMCLHS